MCDPSATSATSTAISSAMSGSPQMEDLVEQASRVAIASAQLPRKISAIAAEWQPPPALARLASDQLRLRRLTLRHCLDLQILRQLGRKTASARLLRPLS